METLKSMAVAGATALAVVAVLLLSGIVETPRVGENLGSVSSPDISSRYVSIGGAELWTQQTSSLQQSTSTVLCSLQSPAATSTLIGGGITLTSATSGASSLSISKSNAQWTVDTLQIIATSSVAANATPVLVAASSTFNGEALNDTIFPPNTYLVFAQQGAGILNQTGRCNAIWIAH